MSGAKNLPIDGTRDTVTAWWSTRPSLLCRYCTVAAAPYRLGFFRRTVCGPRVTSMSAPSYWAILPKIGLTVKTGPDARG